MVLNITSIPWNICGTHIIAHNIWTAGLTGAFNNSIPGYISAKKGRDFGAADKIVNDICSAAAVSKLERRIENSEPVIVTPSKQGNDCCNVLPRAYADFLGSALNLEVEHGIFQVKTPQSRKEMDGAQRIRCQPEFAGAVRPGQDYLIADDVCTTGGTMRALAAYILKNGGNVVGFTALAYSFNPFNPDVEDPRINNYVNGRLAITQERCDAITRRFGDIVNQCLKRTFGFDVRSLTEREGQVLANCNSFGSLTHMVRGAPQTRQPNA